MLMIDFQKDFNKGIVEYLENNISNKQLKESLIYSVGSGGKRIRPYITYKISENILDKKTSFILCYLIEIIHTSSLIHDDLPAIDDSDLRRGKPSNHKKFDEYISILSGDYGFIFPIYKLSLMISNQETMEYLTKSIMLLIEGEMQDVFLEKEKEKSNFDQIVKMYRKKTGILFGLSFSLPLFYIGNINLASEIYNEGQKFGIAFQIYDDIKDILYTEKDLGKNVSKDKNKKTLINLIGRKKAKELADEYFYSFIEYLNNLKYSDLSKELLVYKEMIEKR